MWSIAPRSPEQDAANNELQTLKSDNTNLQRKVDAAQAAASEARETLMNVKVRARPLFLATALLHRSAAHPRAQEERGREVGDLNGQLVARDMAVKRLEDELARLQQEQSTRSRDFVSTAAALKNPWASMYPHARWPLLTTLQTDFSSLESGLRQQLQESSSREIALSGENARLKQAVERGEEAARRLAAAESSARSTEDQLVCRRLPCLATDSSFVPCAQW
jgi:hypothetical protein